jgi:hypothetical protein
MEMIKTEENYGTESHRNEIQTVPKNIWGDEVLNDSKKSN